MGTFTGWLLTADFDDTIRPEKTEDIPPENAAALAYFIAEGGRATLATGRDLRSYLHIRPLFAHNAPAVLSNGAVLYDGATDTVLYESALPEEIRAALTEVLAAFPTAGLELHRGSEIYVCRRNESVEQHLRRMGATVREARAEDVPGPWNKAVLVFDEGFPAARAAAAWVNERFADCCRATPSMMLTDIVRAGNDKGAGVLRLAERLGVARERLVCVGDGLNDLPMLQIAGHAFAPQNAAEEVRTFPGVTTVGPCPVCLRDVIEELEGRIRHGE